MKAVWKRSVAIKTDNEHVQDVQISQNDENSNEQANIEYCLNNPPLIELTFHLMGYLAHYMLLYTVYDLNPSNLFTSVFRAEQNENNNAQN